MKVRVASNGINSEVIQFSVDVATPWAIISPSQFVRSTWKLPSKNQEPRACPVTVRGLLTT